MAFNAIESNDRENDGSTIIAAEGSVGTILILNVAVSPSSDRLLIEATLGDVTNPMPVLISPEIIKNKLSLMLSKPVSVTVTTSPFSRTCMGSLYKIEI